MPSMQETIIPPTTKTNIWIKDFSEEEHQEQHSEEHKELRVGGRAGAKSKSVEDGKANPVKVGGAVLLQH